MNKIFCHILLISCLIPFPLKAQEYSLEQCQEMALQHNADMKMARIRQRMADEDKAVAFTKYFPTLSGNATGFISAKNLIDTEIPLINQDIPLPILDELGVLHRVNVKVDYDLSVIHSGAMVGANVMQPLFAGGRIVNGNKLAALQQEVRRLEYDMTAQQVRQNVSDYYWQMVGVNSNLQTLDTADAQLTAIHELVQDLLDAGIVTRSDLLTVELKQQEMRSLRVKVNNGLELLRLVMAELVGADMESFRVALPAKIDECATPADDFIDPMMAAIGRDEMELAGKGVEAKKLAVRMERGKYMPTVGIGASGGYSHIHMGGRFADNNRNYLIGMLTVNVPISQWWEGTHNIRKAKYAQQSAEIVRENAMSKLLLDIRNSWNKYTEAYEQVMIGRKSVEVADENLRLCKEQYEAGVLSIMDYLNAVTLNTRAHSELGQHMADCHASRYQYIQKTGRTF